MASKLKRTLLLPIPYILTDRIGSFITRLLSKKLTKELLGEITDKFLWPSVCQKDIGKTSRISEGDIFSGAPTVWLRPR
jgi:hypothetical protein